MKRDMVTRSMLGISIDFKPGDLVRYYTTADNGEYEVGKKRKQKTLKVVRQYPYMIHCRDFDGFSECFTFGDVYAGLIVKVND